jgi:acyl CoA:acetate/3-ketoacid CoA transferase beta subunit
VARIVGIGLPSTAANLARRTHVPNLTQTQAPTAQELSVLRALTEVSR